MKRHIVCAITGLLLVAPHIADSAALPADIEGELRTKVFQWINRSRREERLPPLRYSNEIADVATAHADDTAIHFDPATLESRERTYLAHTSSDGKNLEQRFAVRNVPSGWGYAENAGYWIRDPFGDLRENAEYGLRLIHEGMMAEVPPNDAHRENILGPYSHVGMGLSLLQDPKESLNAIFLVTNFSRYGSEEEELKFRESFGHIPTSTRSLKDPNRIPTHDGVFVDVRPDHPFADAIEAMHTHGILQGYEDISFRPEKTVSRAELVKMMLVAIGISPIGREFNECFSDVFNQWFAPYACLARREGWITGYDDGSFRPAQEISRAEGLTIMARIFALKRMTDSATELYSDVPPGSWFEVPTLAMMEYDLLPFKGNELHPNLGLTRGEAAEILHRAMQNGVLTAQTEENAPAGAPRNLHEEIQDEAGTMIRE